VELWPIIFSKNSLNNFQGTNETALMEEGVGDAGIGQGVGNEGNQ
jgi:hypothetical protein